MSLLMLFRPSSNFVPTPPAPTPLRGRDDWAYYGLVMREHRPRRYPD